MTAQRERALRKFKENNVSVLILGLKVGGHGLNLAHANRGIMVYVPQPISSLSF